MSCAPDACGGCTHGNTCVGTQCMCGTVPACPAMTPDCCGSFCTNLKNDPNNCGMCGKSCFGYPCNAGQCFIPDMGPGGPDGSISVMQDGGSPS
jgi:hypothetical protein